MKELYIFNQEKKIRQILFQKEDLDIFLQEKSVYALFCTNYKKRLEGYVIESESLDIDGEEYIYVIFESDDNKIYVFNSSFYEKKVEAIYELKKMIKYFPLYGFNSKYLFKKVEKDLRKN